MSTIAAKSRVLRTCECDLINKLTMFWDGKFPEEPAGNCDLIVGVAEKGSPLLGREVACKRGSPAALVPQRRGRRGVAAEAMDLLQGSLVVCSSSECKDLFFRRKKKEQLSITTTSKEYMHGN